VSEDELPPPATLRRVPCTGAYDDGKPVVRNGRCEGCGTEVESRFIPYPSGNGDGYHVALPHDRTAEGRVVEDLVSCSCGGWFGTPIDPMRQLDGSEVLLLSFQGKVDDIQHNQENLVDLVLSMHAKLEELLEKLGDDA
jgi:hypothetical protein